MKKKGYSKKRAYQNRRKWMRVGLICFAVVYGASLTWFHLSQAKTTTEATKGTLTLDEALNHFKEYMTSVIDKYQLPHSNEMQDEDLATTLLELTKHARTINGEDRVGRSAVEKLEKLWKEKVKPWYQRHFEARITTSGALTKKLAKNRIKEEIMRMLGAKYSPEETKAIWKEIKQEFVYPALNRKVILEGEEAIASIPVVSEKDVNRILRKTQEYVTEQYLQDAQAVRKEAPVKAQEVPVQGVHSKDRRKAAN